MARRGKKGLSPEDLELWQKVRDTATPLHPERKTVSVPKMVAPQKTKKVKPQPDPIPSFSIGQKAQGKAPSHALAPSIVDHLAAKPVQMDNKSFGKLRRGKMSPESRIDLHGLTLSAAHPKLLGFILRSHSEGKRLVLVITGKGKQKDEGGPIPVRHGVLRHQVPQWLSMPPLSQIVMQVVQAHQSHGGGGAYYVYLRRNR